MNSTDEKYVCVEGSGFVDDDFLARSGFNPYLTVPKKPYIKKGIKPTKKQVDDLRKWNDYQVRMKVRLKLMNSLHTVKYFLDPQE